MKTSTKFVIAVITPVILFAGISTVKAEGDKLLTTTSESTGTTSESASGVTVSPSSITLQTTDYGKIYTFTVSNNTETDVKFKLSEGLVARNSDGTTVPLNKDVTNSFVELYADSISVAKSSTQEFKVRTKVVANKITTQFPAIVLTPEGSTTTQTTGINYEIYIPIIAQNTEGKLHMSSTMQIDVENYSFTPNVTISGTVTNDGDKFFKPSGTIVVLKDGVKIHEEEITSQIAKLMMAGDSTKFSYTWVNPDQSISAAGEYTVETRITNDLSEEINGSRIKYIYVPMDLVYVAGGALAGIILLVTVIIVIKKIVSKKKAAQAVAENYFN